MRRLSLLFTLALASGLSAQDGIPKRPKLPREADTLDARAYWDWAVPAATPWNKRHEAYYWAWRLEPDVTAYLVGRWFALLNQQPVEWQDEYFQGAEYVLKSKTSKLIDSLYGEVLERDPFPRFDLPCYYPDLTAEIRDPLTAGIVHYRRNCYPQAAEKLGEALAKDPTLLGTRITRARASFFARQYRAAAADIQVVLDSLRARDEKYIGVWYNTKELLEHMTALSLLRARDIAGARAALGRALTENLSYFPAHAELSQIAMDQGQIPTALQEAELAVGLEENDGVLHYDYGVLLFRSGKLTDAEAQLKRAVELEPYWAEARRMLAVTLDQQKKAEEAITAYEAFLARAPRRENIRIKEAQDRIAALRTGS